MGKKDTDEDKFQYTPWYRKEVKDMSEVYLAVDDFFYNPYFFIVKDRLFTMFTPNCFQNMNSDPY
jgi:cytolysin (calcineurin-like family phosphatase)